MTKDCMIHGMLVDRALRFVAIDGTQLVRDAQKTHGLSRVATAALGHFGRTGKRFTWEKTDKAAALKKAAKV